MRFSICASRFVRLPLFLLCSVSFVSCGGGGSGSSSTPVASGNSSNASVAGLEALRITGVVSDSAIANADVVVKIGEKEFSTKADGEGKYSIELQLPADELDNLVNISATGVGTQSHVTLISQLESASDLLNHAGSDRNLSSEENFGVNVTNLSTAEYVLLSDKLGGNATSETLSSAKLSVDAQQAMDIAVALKANIDFGVDLPKDVNSIDALLKNRAHLASFVYFVKNAHPEIFTEAVDKVKTDPVVVSPTQNKLTTDFILTTAIQNKPVRFRLLFGEDGSGELISVHGKRSFKWKESEGSTNVSLDSALKLGLPAQSPELIDLVLKPININNGQFNIDTEIKLRVSGSDLNEIRLSKLQQALSDVEAAELIGTWYLNQSQYATYKLELLEDGQGSLTKYKYFDMHNDIEQSIENISWSYAGNKLSFTSGAAEGSIYLINKVDVGFEFFGEVAGVVGESLMAREQSVSISDTEIIGRWIEDYSDSVSYVYDFLDNGRAHLSNYSEALNWDIKERNIQSTLYGQYLNIVPECYPNTSHPCYPEFDDNLFVIAKSADTIYALKTENWSPGGKAILSVPKVVKLRKGDISKIPHIFKYYYDVNSNGDIEYWSFSGHDITKRATPYISQNPNDSKSLGVFENKVIYKSTDSHRIFELEKYEADSVTFCEYALGEVCTASTARRTLKPDPRVSVEIIGRGYYTTIRASYGTTSTITAVPDDGYKLDAASGCGVVFSGDNDLETEPLTADCSITLSFVPE